MVLSVCDGSVSGVPSSTWGTLYISIDVQRAAPCDVGIPCWDALILCVLIVILVYRCSGIDLLIFII